MIDHKLAKQLKDAGFLQKYTKWDGEFYFSNGMGRCYLEYVEHEEKQAREKDSDIPPREERLIYIPTLSELIEACLLKHCVFRLYCWEHGFVIGFQPEEKKDDMKICEAPDVAVAKLWLMLNKNDPART